MDQVRKIIFQAFVWPRRIKFTNKSIYFGYQVSYCFKGNVWNWWMKKEFVNKMLRLFGRYCRQIKQGSTQSSTVACLAKWYPATSIHKLSVVVNAINWRNNVIFTIVPIFWIFIIHKNIRSSFPSHWMLLIHSYQLFREEDIIFIWRNYANYTLISRPSWQRQQCACGAVGSLLLKCVHVRELYKFILFHFGVLHRPPL